MRIKMWICHRRGKLTCSEKKLDCDKQAPPKHHKMSSTAEVVDPITLGAKLVDVRDKRNCCCDDDFDVASVPESVCRVFDDTFVTSGEAKRVFVSLGIFSIIKLERRVQLLIPSYDFCVPNKECVGSTDDNPCDLFERIAFPIDEFFPPEKSAFVDCENPDPTAGARIINDGSDCGC